MKGHNYGLCSKCGQIHIHPKGMLNKKNPNAGFKRGIVAWNKGLTKEIDDRVAKYGKSISKSFINRRDGIERWKEIGANSLRKYNREHPEHQSIDGAKGFATMLSNRIKKSFVSLPQRKLFVCVGTVKSAIDFLTVKNRLIIRGGAS